MPSSPGCPCATAILRSATWEALADAKGYMSEKQYRIYDQLAKNEVGLICTGYAALIKKIGPMPV